MWCRCEARSFAAAARDRHLKHRLNRRMNQSLNRSFDHAFNDELDRTLNRRSNRAPLSPTACHARSLRAV